MKQELSRSASGRLHIVFENERSEVSAALLIGSLMHTTSVLQSVGQSLGDGGELDIKIRAFEQGSFQVVLELAERTASWLFSATGVGYVSDVISIARELYALTKHLGGKRPQSVARSGGQVTIINHYGGSIHIDQRSYQIFNSDEAVRRELQKQFEELSAYKEVSGFRFEGGDEVVRAEQSEFSAMGRPIPTQSDRPEPEVRLLEDVRLLILRPSFDPKLPWDFLYEGRKISARIKDEAILAIVDSGERFSKGSRMLVDLEETRFWDEELGEFTLERDSYHVLRFKQHLPAAHAVTLFD